MQKLTPTQQKLVEDNHDLIYWMLSKYNLDERDYYDVAAIGLIKAAMSYIPSKSAFSSYAHACMLNEIRSEVRKLRQTHISLNDVYEFDDGVKVKFIDALKSKNDDYHYTDCRVSILHESEKLKNKHKPVLWLLALEYNQKEIAEMLGLKQTGVSYKVQKIRAVLSAAM